MANYFARLAAAGARMGFDARSSFLPPANVPALGRANPEGENRLDLGDEQPVVVAEPPSPATGVAVESDPSQRAASSGSELGSSTRADDRDPQSHSHAPEWSTAPSSIHIGPTLKLPLAENPPERGTPDSPQMRIPAIGARAAQRLSEQSSLPDKPAAVVQETPHGRVSPIPQRAPRPLEPAMPTIPSAQEAAAAVGALRMKAGEQRSAPEVPRREQGRESVAAERHSTTAVQPAVEVGSPRVRPGMSPFLPRISRNTEPDTRITIGRVDVQVNNQPLTPPPGRPAPKASSNREDTLRTRFLDRFTLRP
jgi:hypothetical protein